MSMTRQTTLNNILGFLSINGTYIPSSFRKAVEFGGMFLMDEIDAADPNVILALNTIENGFVAFPDKTVDIHPNFRWVATANPQDKHHIYTGRSKLDAATLDRFDIVDIPLDMDLEVSLTDKRTANEIKLMRSVLKDYNASKQISMRDTLRYYQRKQVDLGDNYHISLLENEEYLEAYNTKLDKLYPPKPKAQEECETIDELWETIIKEDIQQTSEEIVSAQKEKEMAKDIAYGIENIAGYQIPKGWEVQTGPSVEDPFSDSIKVLNRETGNKYKF